MGWRVVYITEGKHLSLYLDNVKVESSKDDKTFTIPLRDIHSLIIDNYKTTLTVRLRTALSEFNINVILCNVEHQPQTLIMPMQGIKKAPLVLRKQLKWNDLQKGIVHQNIVKAKLMNQRDLLIHAKAEKTAINLLDVYINEIQIGDVTNREGLGAKVYFRALFGPNFKRFNEDVINAGLNYGYSIVRSQMSKTLVAKGLNTSLGIFHKGPENSFNLSDDFMEPFRPLVDHCVHETLREVDIFKLEHRLKLIEHTTKGMYFKNQKQTIFNVMNLYVEGTMNFLETGDLEKIDYPVFKYHEL